VEDLQRILDNNRLFANEITKNDPGFFERNASKQ
jgi:hypothetical protein